MSRDEEPGSESAAPGGQASGHAGGQAGEARGGQAGAEQAGASSSEESEPLSPPASPTHLHADGARYGGRYTSLRV